MCLCVSECMGKKIEKKREKEVQEKEKQQEEERPTEGGRDDDLWLSPVC